MVVEEQLGKCLSCLDSGVTERVRGGKEKGEDEEDEEEEKNWLTTTGNVWHFERHTVVP
jgi:hypothetical protein